MKCGCSVIPFGWDRLVCSKHAQQAEPNLLREVNTICYRSITSCIRWQSLRGTPVKLAQRLTTWRERQKLLWRTLNNVLPDDIMSCDALGLFCVQLLSFIGLCSSCRMIFMFSKIGVGMRCTDNVCDAGKLKTLLRMFSVGVHVQHTMWYGADNMMQSRRLGRDRVFSGKGSLSANAMCVDVLLHVTKTGELDPNRQHLPNYFLSSMTSMCNIWFTKSSCQKESQAAPHCGFSSWI